MSFSDLRRVLEADGLACRGAQFDRTGLSVLSGRLQSAASPAVAIAAVPASAGAEHFVVVLGGTRETLRYVDAARSGEAEINIDQFQDDLRLPVLLVGVDRAAVDGIVERRLALPHAFRDVFSSPIVAGGVCVAALILLVRRRAAVIPAPHAKRILSAARAFANGIHRRRRTLGSAALGCGIVAALGVVGWGRLTPVSDLSVEPGCRDLGRLAQGSKHVVQFVVRNTGSRAISVEDIVVSCSCLETSLTERVIPAGGESSLRIELMAAKLGGTTETILLVPSDARDAPGPIEIEYDGYEAAYLSPTYFNVGTFAAEFETSKEIELQVKDYSGPALPLGPPAAIGGAATVIPSWAGEGILSDGGTLRLRLTCPATKAAGSFSQKISFASWDDAVSFVVVAHGAIGPAVTSTPQSLVIEAPWDAAADRSRRAEFKVRSLAGPVEIDSLSVAPNVLALTVDRRSANGRELVVQVAPAARVAPNVNTATIRVKLKRPLSEEIAIPVYFWEPVAASGQ